MKDIKWLIIPDVHGREFWKEPVAMTLQDTDARICYLGDYHDPYSRDFNYDEDYLQKSVDNFKQILELKKQNPDRVTLLIGNHDCGYAISDDICSSRMDIWHRRELEKIFQDNWELFQIAEECDIAGRHFVFSHAGILKGWADLVWRDEMGKPGFNVVDHLNNAWLTNDWGVLNLLGDYDIYRGWRGYQFGSPVWSDIRSWVRVTPEETFGFNIVGHTQLEKAVMLDTIADLDCRQAFYLDSDGNIRYYDTDDILSNSVEFIKD